MKEPIPAGPFLAWADERIAAIGRDLGGGHDVNPQERFVVTLGWPRDTGNRTLYRWRHEQTHVPRAVVEDALDAADVAFSDVYPDEPVPTAGGPVRLGQSRRMTDAQVLAAHTVYMRGRLTMPDVAERIWRRYGYASAGSACTSLINSFRGLGLPLRQCAATTVAGARCRRPPISGQDVCADHKPGPNRPSNLAGRASAASKQRWAPDELLSIQAQALYAAGLSTRAVARQLLPLTPLTSAEYLATFLRPDGSTMTPTQPSSHELTLRLDRMQAIFTLLDDRVDICEQDLDCDTEGSIAQAIGELRSDLADMRVRLDEFCGVVR